jgi:hypothetical protein
MRSILRAAAGLLLIGSVSSPAIGENNSPADVFYERLQLDHLVVEATTSAKRVVDQKRAALPAAERSSPDNSAAAVDSARAEFRTHVIQLINSSFTPEELSQVNAFLSSDAGKAFQAFTPTLGHGLSVELLRASVAVARAGAPPQK